MTVAIGLELSAEVDAAAIAVAALEGKKWTVDLAFYGSPEAAVTEAGKLYSTTDNCGVHLDPMPCAGLLDDLRAAGIWVAELGRRTCPRPPGSSPPRYGPGG